MNMLHMPLSLMVVVMKIKTALVTLSVEGHVHLCLQLKPQGKGIIYTYFNIYILNNRYYSD